MVEGCGAAPEVATGARPRTLRHEAGGRRAEEERCAVPAHADGCSLGRSESPRCKVPPRRLRADMAGRRDDVRLHVLARGASSGADLDAGAPARLPRPGAEYLAMGEALETNRPEHAATLSKRRT